jgi:arsenate reductase (thioredoxin)
VVRSARRDRTPEGAAEPVARHEREDRGEDRGRDDGGGAVRGDAAVAWSGGCEPGTSINASALAATRERGIDISGQYPKPWTDEVVRAADVVVTMGCGDACPVFPGTRYENWEVDDPAGLDLAAVRPIRDESERRVRRLLDDLGVAVA